MPNSTPGYRSNFNFILFNVAAFVTYITVAIPFIRFIDGRQGQEIVTMQLLAFGLVLIIYWFLEGKPVIYTHIYIVVQVSLVMSTAFVDPNVPFHLGTLFFVLAAQLAVFLPMGQSIVWLLIFSVLSLGSEYYLIPGSNVFDSSLATVGGYIFFGTFGYMLRDADKARRHSDELRHELEDANEQLRAYAHQVEQLAISEERNRLARELHDALGHRLTVAIVQLEGAQRLIDSDPGRSAMMIDTMRSELKQGLAELRETVATLRTNEGERLTLSTALRRLAQNMAEATGIRVEMDLPEGMAELPAGLHHALFRATQESLTNVQRHANATTVWLSLAVDPATVTLVIADDGDGFPAEIGDNHFGLQGIRERVQLLSGTVTLDQRPGGGARVQVTAPIHVNKGAEVWATVSAS